MVDESRKDRILRLELALSEPLLLVTCPGALNRGVDCLPRRGQFSEVPRVSTLLLHTLE